MSPLTFDASALAFAAAAALVVVIAAAALVVVAAVAVAFLAFFLRAGGLRTKSTVPPTRFTSSFAYPSSPVAHAATSKVFASGGTFNVVVVSSESVW